MLEDLADLGGVGIAFFGIWLAHRLGQPRLDGVATLLIGCLLTAVALVMARESKGLLLGEGMNGEELRNIRKMIRDCPGVERVDIPLTMYLGPEAILLAVDVEFAEELDSGALAEAIDGIEAVVRKKYPAVSRIYIEAQKVGSAVASSSVPSQTGHRL